MKPKLRIDENIASQQDLKALILEVHEYARWYMHNAIKKRVHAKSKKRAAEPVLSPAATATIHSWNAEHPLSQKSFDELTRTLEAYAAEAPELSITLAAPPTSGVKRVLVGWCRDNISPHTLVNFQFNTNLLGGMVVRSGSHVYDWSFRRHILENLDKFPEALRNA
ncbi:MAG TPA: hypothetical protein VHD60_01195 [Candidatus Saccharimonadales bacterium]|nr:hypothetical protein [Candidatus Saccharimonadales bacterium]